MATKPSTTCDVAIQTAAPRPHTHSPILDHRLYNFDDSNADWSFLEMENSSMTSENGNPPVRQKAGQRPLKGTTPTLPSPQEDGYCSQEEGNEWEAEDGYKSPLKDAPSYQTYLALVPDLDGDSGPETPCSSAAESTSSLPKKVSDEQSGGRGDSTPLFEQSPASTPSELASPISENLSIDDAERGRLKTELAEVELDIEALRQTLRAKEIRAKEIRRLLGITPVAVFKNDMKTGWTNFKQSSAYVNTSNKFSEWNEAVTSSSMYSKTKTGLQSAGQKTGAAFSSFGSAVTKKLGEVRESTAFKSFEEKVSNTATTIKTKVSGTKEEESSFEDVLQSTANQHSPDPQPEQPLPEEKVPM
ncbi:uncharacterized protein [Diadema setosum]|uniref:uncharacterized protein n=1 Tax=Diadema setosum TaxID=31175 RepID=UPI003B3B6CC5